MRRVWSWKVKLFSYLPADCRAFCYWMESGLQRRVLQLDEIIADAGRNIAFEIDRMVVDEALRILNDPSWWSLPRVEIGAPVRLPLSIRTPGRYPTPPPMPVSIRYEHNISIPMDWTS